MRKFVYLALVVVALGAMGCAKSHDAAIVAPAATAADVSQLFASASVPPYARWYDGQWYESQGHDHFANGQSNVFAYSTDPPTSGPHVDGFTETFNSSTPLPAALQVSLLEHGNVLLQYNCNCPDIAASLYTTALEFDAEWIRPDKPDPLPADVEDAEEEGRAVIVAPYPGMQHMIALTAWTRLGTLDIYDQDKIGSFMHMYLHNMVNAAR